MWKAFFDWLASGTLSSIILISLAAAVIAVLAIIMVVAFFQGRSINIIRIIRIGPKPINRQKSSKQDLLEDNVENASIIALCKQLGIRDIFENRNHLFINSRYNINAITQSASPGTSFRVIARSFNQLINSVENIKDVIRRGANVELCCFDPTSDATLLDQIADHKVDDTKLALKVFRDNYITWLQNERPSGTVEIRYHQVHLLDSYFGFVLNGEALAIWDLSFGRDTADKCIFVLDPLSGRKLGNSLQARYKKIWESAARKFKYFDKETAINELGI